MAEKDNVLIEKHIIETIQKTKEQTFEIVITAVFGSIALFLYLLGFSTFLPFIVLFFGALWNFFTPINRFMAIAFGFVVCTLYSLFALEHGLYGHAFLHLVFYLPTQLIMYYTNRGKPAIEIKKGKRLAPLDYVFVAITGILVLIFTGIILSKIEGAVLPFLDATSVVFLILSVFLVNSGFSEYFMWRVFATLSGALLWMTLGIAHGFKDGIITMILLFVMYALVDGVRGVIWMLDDIPTKTQKTQIDEKKLEEAKQQDSKNAEEKAKIKAMLLMQKENEKNRKARTPRSKSF